tara:strand:- start:306 stop:581 length:276 start_codon:yes stop_codon:yes gene_type:complete
MPSKEHIKSVSNTAKELGLKYDDINDCVIWFCKEMSKDLLSGVTKSIRLFSIGCMYRRETPYVKKKRKKIEESDSKEHKKHLFLQRRVQTF